jgi:hypothetical protein
LGREEEGWREGGWKVCGLRFGGSEKIGDICLKSLDKGIWDIVTRPKGYLNKGISNRII